MRFGTALWQLDGLNIANNGICGLLRSPARPILIIDKTVKLM
jgi:hypothetical protein